MLHSTQFAPRNSTASIDSSQRASHLYARINLVADGSIESGDRNFQRRYTDRADLRVRCVSRVVRMPAPVFPILHTMWLSAIAIATTALCRSIKLYAYQPYICLIPAESRGIRKPRSVSASSYGPFEAHSLEFRWFEKRYVLWYCGRGDRHLLNPRMCFNTAGAELRDSWAARKGSQLWLSVVVCSRMWWRLLLGNPDRLEPNTNIKYVNLNRREFAVFRNRRVSVFSLRAGQKK